MEHQKQTALSIAQGHLKQQKVKPPSAGLGGREPMLTGQFGNATDAMGIAVAAENGGWYFHNEAMLIITVLLIDTGCCFRAD